MTIWLWYDPSNVSQHVRRLYGMNESIWWFNEVTLWLWYDPSNVSQNVRRLYDMDEPIRNVCIYYLAGSSFRTLLIWYVTWYELTNQNAVFPFLCPYMVFRVLVSQKPHYHTTFAKSPFILKQVGCYKQIARSCWLIPNWHIV